jgi:hypothetical protein
MVVITIMTILTAVFLLQQRQFDSSTLLRSLAYSVALSIREAQTYGTSVRSFDTGTGITFPAYGIYFDIGTPDRYLFFADVNNDGWYTNGTDGIVDEYVFQGNYSINDLCAPVDVCAASEMSLTFKRPNPEACIKVADTDECSAYPDGRIQIIGPGGTTRSVQVTTSGQISVGTPEI